MKSYPVLKVISYPTHYHTKLFPDMGNNQYKGLLMMRGKSPKHSETGYYMIPKTPFEQSQCYITGCNHAKYYCIWATRHTVCTES